MKNRRFIVFFLVFCTSCLMAAASCSAASGIAVSAQPADTAQLTQASDPALSDLEGETAMDKITLSFNDRTYTATLADNPSAQAFAELLKDGPLTVSAHDYGNFEKVGSLGTELPRTDEQITTAPGDIILYQGNQITVYYAQNTWNFTRLGRIDDPSGLRDPWATGMWKSPFSLPSRSLMTASAPSTNPMELGSGPCRGAWFGPTTRIVWGGTETAGGGN